MYKDALKNEDIDSNLLLAAEKYNGKRLIDVCLRHLLKNIDASNVMEIVVAAYLINHDHLLQEGSKFILEQTNILIFSSSNAQNEEEHHFTKWVIG